MCPVLSCYNTDHCDGSALSHVIKLVRDEHTYETYPKWKTILFIIINIQQNTTFCSLTHLEKLVIYISFLAVTPCLQSQAYLKRTLKEMGGKASKGYVNDTRRELYDAINHEKALREKQNQELQNEKEYRTTLRSNIGRLQQQFGQEANERAHLQYRLTAEEGERQRLQGTVGSLGNQLNSERDERHKLEVNFGAANVKLDGLGEKLAEEAEKMGELQHDYTAHKEYQHQVNADQNIKLAEERVHREHHKEKIDRLEQRNDALQGTMNQMALTMIETQRAMLQAQGQVIAALGWRGMDPAIGEGNDKRIE